MLFYTYFSISNILSGPKFAPDGEWVPNHPGVPANLMTRKIGPLFHARWLTLACRVMRAYMSMCPSHPKFGKIKSLALYVTNIYFPVHMDIKVI